MTVSTLGPFQVMPPLTADEYDALRADIAAHGVTVPIVRDQHDRVIDGHHRLAIAAELGIDPDDIPWVCREVVNAQEARSLAYALNLHRRHLTREQRRELLERSLRADPHLSDRQHADRAGVSPTTAGAVRSELEAAGDVSKLDTRTDSAGRQQPAARPPVKTATHLCDCGEPFKSPVRHCHGCGEHYLPGQPCPKCDVAVDGNGEVLDIDTPTTQPAAARAVPLPAPPRDHERERLVAQMTRLVAAVNALDGLPDDVARARYVREWDPALSNANPEHVTPDHMRAIAHGLLAFADELERHRGLRVV